MKQPLLGEIPLKKNSAHFKSVFQEWDTPSFQSQTLPEKIETISRALLDWLQKEPMPCFLLPDVLEFIEQIDKKKILSNYTFNSFELWLNQFSHLSFEENYKIRAKIAGKWIDRANYQILFPIGMGKVYEGTHFVTAHKSPDLDTTIASFWGWLDAFAARVGEALHIWNLPGGPPSSQIEIDWLFRDCLGEAVFTQLAKTRTALHLTGRDLMSQKQLLKKQLDDSITSIDHERDQNIVVVVDGDGFYLGDWRGLDVESVSELIAVLSLCLQWFENQLHLQLISLFTRPQLLLRDISPLLVSLFDLLLETCEPAQKFTRKQKRQMDCFLKQILGLKDGIHSSFRQLVSACTDFAHLPFHSFEELVMAMKVLFDAQGNLEENRPRIFEFLEKVVKGLHDSILQIRKRLEKLDVALKTKYEVLGNQPHFGTVDSDVEELLTKIGNHVSLTIVYPEEEKKYPMGVILASEIRKPILGTVSLRDFCNKDEMTIPPYLDVISVIDHHKSQLNTFSPPLAIIADVQSSNSLVAKAAFEINDRVKRTKATSFVDPKREFLEYLHFLYGILDDTDLLSKVSMIDLECVTSLLNRLKTLQLGKETEIVSVDDLPRDNSFLKKGAKRLLQNEDLYSLYKKVYAFREQEMEKTISLCSEGKVSSFFADTKEQNGCCRVGQTKVFAKNIPHYAKHSQNIRYLWQTKAGQVCEQNPEINLHIHMMSTVVSAEEVYRDVESKHSHQDELWLWAPLKEESGRERLKRFLHSFQLSPGLKDNPLEIECFGENGEKWAQLFKENFLEIPHKISKKGPDMAILRYRSGSLNSRKAMISPFLPTL